MEALAVLLVAVAAHLDNVQGLEAVELAAAVQFALLAPVLHVLSLLPA